MEAIQNLIARNPALEKALNALLRGKALLLGLGAKRRARRLDTRLQIRLGCGLPAGRLCIGVFREDRIGRLLPEDLVRACETLGLLLGLSDGGIAQGRR